MTRFATGISHDRRTFMRSLVAGAAGLAASSIPSSPANAKTGEAGDRLHIACNEYPWWTFYRRDKLDFKKDYAASIAKVASTGVQGYEALFNTPADVDRLGPLLAKHKLEMRSFYMNTWLHEENKAKTTIDNALAVASKAARLGARIMVTNPTPIRWGGKEDKTDAQLRTQAKHLQSLAEQLKKLGVTLAYHNHDAEMRRSAREFHHMMLGTNADDVKLCLDAHWVYRGSGNSSVALFDIVKLYGPRIVELHLRQSVKGIWTEAFGDGDIDYPRLAKHLLSIAGSGAKPHLTPHLTLEQAVEKATPNTMDAVKAHKLSLPYTRKVFAGFR